jgi:hypothetical protein
MPDKFAYFFVCFTIYAFISLVFFLNKEEQMREAISLTREVFESGCLGRFD